MHLGVPKCGRSVGSASCLGYTALSLPARRAAIAALGLPTAHNKKTAMSDTPGPKKRLARRRRANAPGGRPHLHKVRTTTLEEAQLAQRAAAQHVSIPRLMMESALSDRDTPTEWRHAIAELFAFRGQLTGAATNLNQLAKVANTEGHTPVGTAAGIEQLARVVDKIDAAIDDLVRW